MLVTRSPARENDATSMTPRTSPQLVVSIVSNHGLTYTMPLQTYILIVRNTADAKIQIGSLGALLFKRGYYAYVGSAKRNLEARIRRHLRKEKKLHWHIDYLLNASSVSVETVLLLDAPECTVARLLSEHFPCVERFGASDCRCNSHLFFAERPSFENALRSSNLIFKHLEC